MQVLKWIAIGVAALGTLVLVGCVGLVGWGMSIESIKLTEADLETGGEFPDAERSALVSACTSMSKGTAGADKMCACVADVASTDMSRFERYVVTATFEQSPGKIISLIKGLTEAGVPAERLQELQTANKEEQVKSALERCAAASIAGDAPAETEETVSSEEKTAGEEAPVAETPDEEASEENKTSDESSDASSSDKGEENNEASDDDAPSESSDE